MRELAASRVRFGYRRLTVLLRREGWVVNAKRIYRLYTEDGLAVRTKVRKKIARRARVLALKSLRPNQKWSMDFVAARLIDRRWLRVLTVIDQFTRQCVLLLADRSLTGHKVALALSQVIAERGAPISITVDNGTEFASKAMDAWAYQYGVQLNFIRPGRPTPRHRAMALESRMEHGARSFWQCGQIRTPKLFGKQIKLAFWRFSEHGRHLLRPALKVLIIGKLHELRFKARQVSDFLFEDDVGRT
jgi:transposase InsO family protein